MPIVPITPISFGSHFAPNRASFGIPSQMPTSTRAPQEPPHAHGGVADVAADLALEWSIKKFLGVHFAANWLSSAPEGFLERK